MRKMYNAQKKRLASIPERAKKTNIRHIEHQFCLHISNENVGIGKGQQLITGFAAPKREKRRSYSIGGEDGSKLLET